MEQFLLEALLGAGNPILTAVLCLVCVALFHPFIAKEEYLPGPLAIYLIAAIAVGMVGAWMTLPTLMCMMGSIMVIPGVARICAFFEERRSSKH